MQKIKIFNTLSGKKDILIPQKGKQINLFVCGPTVYDYSHLGHARNYVVFDCFVKYLEHAKYKKSLFTSYIRINQIFANCYNKGTSIYDTVKNNTAQEDIDLLTREVLGLYAEKEIDQRINLV